MAIEDRTGEPPADEPQEQGQAPGLPPGPEATELERLQAELEEAERERVQFRNLAQRVQADFANYRRRAEEEHQEFQRNANAELILKLLPVLDDLDRALQHGPQPGSKIDAGWLEGVHLVARKFQSIVEEVGLQRIEAEDRQFDPWEHEVVSYQETSEHPEGRILALVRAGYKLNGRVLRPAQVMVAKSPLGQSLAEESSPPESGRSPEEPSQEKEA